MNSPIKHTKREIVMDWRNYGSITIPKGQPASPTTHGEYFVESVEQLFPKGSMMLHDATYYGIRIPFDEVEECD